MVPILAVGLKDVARTLLNQTEVMDNLETNNGIDYRTMNLVDIRGADN